MWFMSIYIYEKNWKSGESSNELLSVKVQIQANITLGIENM